MRSIIIEDHKKALTLTKRQRELIVGLLLGDGHLETQNNRTYRLKVEHGIKQKEYVDWLYENFSEWVHQPPKARTKDSFGKEIISYGFTTYSSGFLRFYAQQFYSDKEKIIPRVIHTLLSPLAIAIWFMDDGSWKSSAHRTYIIHALGYRKSELNLVRKVFQKKFGIRVGIHKQYERWRIYVYSDSSERFRKLIEPHVIPSLKYKLG